MTINKENFKTILEYSRIKTRLWNIYMNYIDPRQELSIKRREIMRAAFMAGVNLCMGDMLIDGKKGNND